MLLVLALALGLRLLFAALMAGTYDPDEFVYLLLGRDLAWGDMPYRDFMFFHPPGILVLLRLLSPLTAMWWPLARLLMILLDTATAGLVWRIAKQLYGRAAGVAAGTLYAISPVALITSGRVELDVVVTTLGMTGLALLLSNRSRKTGVLAGACLGLAIWFKYPAAIFLPVYLLAAPRRTLVWLPAAVMVSVLAFLPFRDELSALYQQTVTWQLTGRNSMSVERRLEIVGLFWLLVNPFALLALLRPRAPVWLLLGFGSGGLFLLASHAYYHYFVPEAAFAAILGAPLAARLPRLTPAAILACGLAVTVGWAEDINLNGPGRRLITATRFSGIRDTVHLLDKATDPGDRVLADRFEYAYLARRPVAVHYFWNMVSLVNARSLERRLPGTWAVIRTTSEPSTYPAGFVQYLDARYPRRRMRTTIVWFITLRG